MSLGMYKRWERAFIRSLALRPGAVVLDACCGTGDVTMLLAEVVGPSGKVIGVDLSEAMIRCAERQPKRLKHPNVRFIRADVTDIPLPSDSVDVCLISFALRNVPDVLKVVGELARIVKPGGTVASLDLTKPSSLWFKPLFYFYLRRVIPALDWLMGMIRPAVIRVRPYHYLFKSVDQFYDAAGLEHVFTEAGLEEVRSKTMLFGAVSMHQGRKPCSHGPTVDLPRASMR